MIATPFESTYASGFIFTLGYIARDEGLDLSASWAMSLAQSPADASIGDMILGWTGRMYVFEFKRAQNQVRTELDKPEKTSLLQHLRSPQNGPARALAVRGHFLGYGESGPTGGLRFFPYLCIGLKPIPFGKSWDTSAFVKNVLFNEAYGLSGEDFGKYLCVLNQVAVKTADTLTGGSGGGRKRATLNALVVGYDRKARQLCFVQLDLLELGRSLENDLWTARGIALGPGHGKGMSR